MKRNLILFAGLLGFAQLSNAQCNPVFTTIPGTIMQTTDPGLCTGNVTYSLPTYSGCTGSLIQTAGLPSGSDFPIGTTTNTFEVYETNYFLQEDFSDNMAGWTLGTEWQIAPAVASTCGGGADWNDPSTDNTPTADNGVAGVVIGGCASTSLHPFYYLTSPVVNTTGATTLTLDFYRWLTSDYTPYMQNIIEVWDGAAWQTIWITGGTGTFDAAWTLQTFDISAYSNANLQVRFGFNINSGGVFTIGQWNLDDVAIYEPGAATGITSSFVVNVMPEAPIINCTGDVFVVNTPNPTCGEIVNYIEPTATSCITQTTSQTAGFPVGAEFPVGTTLVTYESVQDPVAVQFLNEDFSDNNAGWTLDPEWGIGAAVAPFCAGGPGWQDPSTDNSASSDNGVAGVVIGGCASTSLHPFYYLTSPVVNTTGATTLNLDYARWLTSDYTPYMQNVVEVYDGAVWQTIWATGPPPGVADAAWTPQTFDITAYSNANLQVRFGFNVNSGGAYTIGQWNLDDVIISGNLVQTSTCSFNVTVDPIVTAEFASFCAGDTYVFGTQTLTSAGFYVETFTAAAGCDSVVTLNLTEIVYNEVASASICPGDTYVFGTQTLSSAGIYTEVFTSLLGCDSTVTLTLTEIIPPVITVLSTTDEIAGNDGAIDIGIGGGSTYSYDWDNGATTQDISGLTGGNYTVIVTDDVTGCTSTETITVDSQLGISEISKDAFTIHPNPSNGIFFVTVREMESNMRLEILSATGQVVFNKSIVSESTSVDIKNVLPGTYFVRVISDNGMAVESIVIE